LHEEDEEPLELTGEWPHLLAVGEGVKDVELADNEGR
jgi:hypothetical protein